MTEEIIRGFAAQGILGLVVLLLLYMIRELRADLRELRESHRIELVEKDKLILDLQERRMAEIKTTITLTQSVQSTLEAVLAAISRGA